VIVKRGLQRDAALDADRVGPAFLPADPRLQALAVPVDDRTLR
jgi:hypothetical protein